MPSSTDPVYDTIMHHLEQNDNERLEQLDKQLERARNVDWPSKMFQARRMQAKLVEDDMATQRGIVKSFELIKFI
jgi:hypothetical protein